MFESDSLIPAREHFLSLPEVSAFADYLADYIAGRSFDPPYLTQTYRPKAEYCFVSFEDAWDQYIQEESNRRFEDDLLTYENALKEAVKARKDDEFIELTKKIFAARHLVLRSNINKIAEVKNLTDKIDCGCREFASDSPNWDIFGRVYGPAMSSFYSRIYATLIPDFITYESRVSAALCYLIREYSLFCGMDLPKSLNWGVCTVGEKITAIIPATRHGKTMCLNPWTGLKSVRCGSALLPEVTVWLPGLWSKPSKEPKVKRAASGSTAFIPSEKSKPRFT